MFNGRFAVSAARYRALEPRIVRVTAEGYLAALFGVGYEPGNQVRADFDEPVGDRIFALDDVNELVGQVNAFPIQVPELGLGP
jgi:hypothetical protein